MKKLIVLTIVLLSFHQIINAQGQKDNFQGFREKMLSDFQNYRQSVLDKYADFLAGIWKDYDVNVGYKWNPLPKPKQQPAKDKDTPAPPPKSIEPENFKPAEPVAPKEPPQQKPKPIVVDPMKAVKFDWCGMTLQLPDAKIEGNLNGIGKDEILAFLEVLENSKLDKDVLPQMANIANSGNFNDWCLYLMIESYVKKIKANSNINTRNFICWYIMVSFGFDVRICSNGKNIFYMIPFQQKVYAHDFLLINNTPYYIWGEGEFGKDDRINSPELPDDVGSFVNLVMLKPLNIPYLAKRFSHTFSGYTLSGAVNENLIKVMNKFPQMSIPCYAISEGDPKARKQVLDQMGKFISGMSELEAANFILQFIQSFDYATDDEQFGYEKPFFFEETLYYPKCDCEDRAIFYHFLVTNLLRNDVHLVHYPNHMCNAVNFSQKLNADSYIYQGRQYVICDPTYIGAPIGMCMPDFRNTSPEVELVK